MLYTLKYFFIRIDPLHKSIYFVINLFFVTSITSFIWLYIQPPDYTYLLTTPILTEIAASSYDFMQDKIKAILLGCIIYSMGVMLFSVFDSAREILLFVMFIYCFLSLLTSIINPSYHIISCVAIALSTAAFAPEPSWYSGVNAIINIFLVGFISIVINILLSFKRKNQVLFAFASLLKIYLQRLNLIKLSLFNNTQISSTEASKLLAHEIVLRTKFMDYIESSADCSLLDLIKETVFRTNLNKLRFTILSLLSLNETTTISLMNKDIIDKYLNCMINRLTHIIDHFISDTKLPAGDYTQIYNAFNSSFEQDSNPAPIDTRTIAYHLANLNHDLSQLESCITTRQGYVN